MNRTCSRAGYVEVTMSTSRRSNAGSLATEWIMNPLLSPERIMREGQKRVHLEHAPDPGSCTAKLRGCSSKGPDFLFLYTNRCGHDTDAEGQRKPGDFVSGRDLQHDLLPRNSTAD
jgi:hypothetical protein